MIYERYTSENEKKANLQSIYSHSLFAYYKRIYRLTLEGLVIGSYRETFLFIFAKKEGTDGELNHK